MARNRRFYGGLSAHLGLAVLAVGVTWSSSFAQQTQVSIRQGEKADFAGFTLEYEGLERVREPHRTVLVTDLRVTRDDRDAVRATPSLNLYPNASEPIGTPSIKIGWFKDLYTTVVRVQDGGRRATFRFFLNPGVTWLWVGGGVLVLAGLVAAWPRRGPVQRGAVQAAQGPELVEVA